MTPDLILEPDEQQLLNSYEQDEWQSVDALHEKARRYQAHAAAAIEATGLISVALPPEEFEAIRQAAARAGLSYQTFVADIVRRYIHERLLPETHGG